MTKNFIFLKNLIQNSFDEKIFNKETDKPVISLISILDTGELFELILDDLRSLNELKKISNYEVQKN